MAQMNCIWRAGRLTASAVLATLTVFGWASVTAVAAESASIDCQSTGSVGPGPAGGESAAAPAGNVEAAPAQQGVSGFRAYVDPETGQLVEPPEGAAAEEPAAAALSTSDEGLVAVPSPVPGGGNVVDLQGRFRTPLVATIEPDGKVRIQHASCPGNSIDRK